MFDTIINLQPPRFIHSYTTKFDGISAQSGLIVPIAIIFWNFNFSNKWIEVKKLSNYKSFHSKLWSEIRLETVHSPNIISYTHFTLDE